MAEQLTKQQEQAVKNRGGKLLVSAAAGSGKTKVLVDRLMTYLTDEKDPANLDDFLIITYTKAAAAELRGKIAAKLTERIAQAPENRHLQKQMQRLFLTKISTVHGFCSDVLREYAYRLDLAADFRVADENECRELRESVLQALLDRAYADDEENPDFHAFTDTQGLGRDDRLVPQIIEKVYDSARCHLDPDGWLEACLRAAEADSVTDAAQTVWGRFLLEDLHSYLSAQIRIMKQCVSWMEHSEGLEKPICNYRETLVGMELLQAAQTWDEVVKNRNVAFNRLVFPRKNVDTALIDRVRAAREVCKKGLEKKLASFADDSSQVLQDLSQSASGVRGLVFLVRQFDRDFSAAKRSRRVLDFGDLEQKTLDLLLGKNRGSVTAAAEEIGSRYREILVDEYQDSNGVQDAIFSALTARKQNCFLVGDVKQSIYQFRLADPGIFLEKYHQFVPAEQASNGTGRKILLSHNFRSGAEVIEGVNCVFQTCMRPDVGGLYYGDEEKLQEGIPHTPLPDAGVELYVLEAPNEKNAREAVFVADQIKQMLTEGTLIRSGKELRPVEPEDIVILLRSPGSSGGAYRRALEARGIRCSTGGGTDLLQTEEIGTLRCFLRTIVNPRLDIPLISTLASPIFGFTADDLAHFRGEKKRGSVYDALLESDTPKALHFLQVLDILRTESGMTTLTGLLERCLYLTRLDSIYGSMANGRERTANLQAFFQLAADYEKGSLRDLGQFLEHLDSLEDCGISLSSAAPSGCVSIMSIHKSKGLEFPVVFLCDLSRSFNMESLTAQVLCDKELGLGMVAVDPVNRIRYPTIAKRAIAVKMMQQSISEELRVLYVAMTRARDRLIMTYAAKNVEEDLRQIALRYDFDDGDLLCRSASSLGDWILVEAMQHTEAGALHSIGGKPEKTRMGMYPWKICCQDAPECTDETSALTGTTEKMPKDAVMVLQKALSFHYSHDAATRTPSKQTATDRKGRVKDTEAAENTQEPVQDSRLWRKPQFLTPKAPGRDYGNAMHGAMQYLKYENCGSQEAVRREIDRLVAERYLTAEQGEQVNCQKIAAFFATPIGTKLRSGTEYLREFKFSILDDAGSYGEDLEGEKVLLQGVVDCALLEPDGITVVDFKTDYVTEETIVEIRERYRGQVLTYGEALSRIYEMPVKALYLYLFKLDRFVQIL